VVAREVIHDIMAVVFSKGKNKRKFVDRLSDTQTKKNANKIKSWFAEFLQKLKNVIHAYSQKVN